MTTYDEYVELFSNWQETLLETADHVAESNNTHVRAYWRKKLARQFSQFLDEVSEIEFKTSRERESAREREFTTSQQMPPATRLDFPQNIQMSETNNNNNENNDEDAFGNFEEATRNLSWAAGLTARETQALMNGEDIETGTVNGDDSDEEEEEEDFSGSESSDEDAYDIFDDQGSVDMMFDDLNVLRDEYQMIMRYTDQDVEFDDLSRLQEIVEALQTNFATTRDAITRRLGMSERMAEQVIGEIERPKGQTYIQYIQNTGRGLPVIHTNEEATMIGAADYNYATHVAVRLYEDGTYTDFDSQGRLI